MTLNLLVLITSQSVKLNNNIHTKHYFHDLVTTYFVTAIFIIKDQSIKCFLPSDLFSD